MLIKLVKMSGNQLYRVAWKVVGTGFQGYGDYMTYDLAQAWVKYGNEMYGRDQRFREERRGMFGVDCGLVIDHWLELNTEASKNTEGDGKESSTP
jgi:hypothetical protein